MRQGDHPIQSLEAPEWPSVKSLPSAAKKFCDQAQIPEFDVPKLQSLLDEAYKNKLY